MAGFATFASNGTQVLSQTYNPAAKQVNLGCGPGFVNDTVAVTSAASHGRSGLVPSLPSSLGGTTALLSMLALVMSLLL